MMNITSTGESLSMPEVRWERVGQMLHPDAQAFERKVRQAAADAGVELCDW